MSTTIVFDGYDAKLLTKDHEHKWRFEVSKMSANVNVEAAKVVMFQRKRF